MNPELKAHLAVRAGQGVAIGSVFSPRPWYPSRWERATLLLHHLPSWAIASGVTAGWVWSGIGQPEPWSLLRPVRPEISPLERTAWKARVLNATRHHVVSIANLTLLDVPSAVIDILLSCAAIDTCASQLIVMTSLPRNSLLDGLRSTRCRPVQRQHALEVLDALDRLRETYPDITRYTS